MTDIIKVKTPEQIEGIRASCQLAANTLSHLESFIKPGISTDELDKIAVEFIQKHKGTSACLGYNGFPKSICTSVNEVVCHGIPCEYNLKDGDIVSVDVTTILNGYYGDTCQTFQVGRVDKAAKKLIDATHQALIVGINQVKPGNRFGNIGYHINKFARSLGFSVNYYFCGHGVGLEFHEYPQIIHNDKKDTGLVMKPGYIFTIEPILSIGKPDVVINESDGWTAVTIDKKLAAQFEHTVLVTDKCCEILTLPNLH